MDNLEKILLIEIVNKQFGKLPTNHSEYFLTYNSLTEEEKDRYHLLVSKIHDYWNYINLPKFIAEHLVRVNSIFEYNEKIAEVDKTILAICKDFNLTLQNERDEETESLLKKFLGDRYNDLFGLD